MSATPNSAGPRSWKFTSSPAPRRAPPPGITFDDARTTGVEVDGAGADHYVRALAGPRWLKCKWLAKAESSGADGFAKGYCWIGIKK